MAVVFGVATTALASFAAGAVTGGSTRGTTGVVVSATGVEFAEGSESVAVDSSAVSLFEESSVRIGVAATEPGSIDGSAERGVS